MALCCLPRKVYVLHFRVQVPKVLSAVSLWLFIMGALQPYPQILKTEGKQEGWWEEASVCKCVG